MGDAGRGETDSRPGPFHVDPARDVGHYLRCSERYRLRVWRASGLPERAAVHGKQRIG
jgi:hypothetical protein